MRTWYVCGNSGLVYITDRNVFFIMKTVYDRLVTVVTPLD